MDKKKTLLTALKILFGVSLFTYILVFKFNFSVFRDIEFIWTWFILMLMNSTFIAFLRVKKWDILLRNFFRQKYSFRKNWDTILTGQFFAFFTPSRLGDFIRIKYTKKELGYKKSFLAVLMDRVVDLTIMGLLALAGLVFFREEFIKRPQQLLVLIIIVITAGLALLFILHKKLLKLYRPIIRALKKTDTMKHLAFFSIALLVWVLTFSQFYLSFRVIGFGFAFVPLFLMAALSMVAIMMPVSVNGVGVREFMAMTFFPIVVGDGEKAVVALWIVMLANSVYPALLGFFSFTKS